MSRALALVGPTASGKTALSIALARRLGGEVVSMDSRQVYRAMDIGTAKADAAERDAAPHHGIDLIDPPSRYSAGAFARDARRWIEEIRGRGHVPILVGGTGFFLRALTRPLFEEPELDPARRARLERWLEARDEDTLHRWLGRLDPATAAAIAGRGGGGGRQRLLRALEIALLTGRPLSWWHAHAPAAAPAVEPMVFALELSKELLDRRIDERVWAMVRAGFPQEVAALLRAGYHVGHPGMNAVGYPEIAAHLGGEISLEEAVARIQRATRRYARRQLTWFRHQLPPDAVRLDGTRPTDELVEEIARRWTTDGR